MYFLGHGGETEDFGVRGAVGRETSSKHLASSSGLAGSGCCSAR